MRLLRFRIVLLHSLLQILSGTFHLISADILVIDEVGGKRNIYNCFIGPLHRENTIST